MKYCPFDSFEPVEKRDQSYKVYYECLSCKRLFSEDLRRWGTSLKAGYPQLTAITPQELFDGDKWFRRPDGDHPDPVGVHR